MGNVTPFIGRFLASPCLGLNSGQARQNLLYQATLEGHTRHRAEEAAQAQPESRFPSDVLSGC